MRKRWEGLGRIVPDQLGSLIAAEGHGVKQGTRRGHTGHRNVEGTHRNVGGTHRNGVQREQT